MAEKVIVSGKIALNETRKQSNVLAYSPGSLHSKQTCLGTCVGAHHKIEWSRFLLYYSEALEFTRGYIDGHQTDIIFGLCAAELLIFFMILISFISARGLRKRVHELNSSVTRLLNDEAARYTRSILGREKDNP